MLDRALDTRRHRIVRSDPFPDKDRHGKTHRVLSGTSDNAPSKYEVRFSAEFGLSSLSRV